MEEDLFSDSDNPRTSDEELLVNNDLDVGNSSDSEYNFVTIEDGPEIESDYSNLDNRNPVQQTVRIELVRLPAEESSAGNTSEEHVTHSTTAVEPPEIVNPSVPHNSQPEINLPTANVISTSTSSSRKRSRESSSPNNESRSDDDAMMCPICFESWTTSGAHRLVSLKCGHLFGLACIEKWIKQPKAKCPQCNHLAKRSDIRKIYARCLKVLDTSERDRAIQKFEKEQEKRRHAEVEAVSMRLKFTMAKQECERVKMELQQHKETIQQLRTHKKKGFSNTQYGSEARSQSRVSTPFVLEKTLDLSKDGGCRFLSASNFLPLIVASQPSMNPLYTGFGFKKISTIDFRQTEFIPVHRKIIKDLAFHSHDSLVLSTSEDGTMKITNVISNSVVQTYNLDIPAWSCVWNKDDPSSFFGGLRTGAVRQFDIRMTNSHVCQLPSPEKAIPVVAMGYIQKSPLSVYGMSGPVSLQNKACTFYERKSEEFALHPMPVEGHLTSLSLEPRTGHMLLSCRPSSVHSHVTHFLCELTFANTSTDPTIIEKSCSCNVVQLFEGGSVQPQQTRSHLMLSPGSDSSVLVCSGDQSSKTIMIWDASKGKCISQLPVESPALDICSFKSDSSCFLTAITDKQLKIYKWSDSN